MLKKETKSIKKKNIKRNWHLVDAKGKVLGRVASKIANLLIGKDKPYYVPYLDCGDYVVVINAAKVEVTGRKEKQKMYYRHSGYPGGFRKLTLEQMREKKPAFILRHAVLGMLPKNKLQKRMIRRLKIFLEDAHNYQDKFKK